MISARLYPHSTIILNYFCLLIQNKQAFAFIEFIESLLSIAMQHTVRELSDDSYSLVLVQYFVIMGNTRLWTHTFILSFCLIILDGVEISIIESY